MKIYIEKIKKMFFKKEYKKIIKNIIRNLMDILQNIKYFLESLLLIPLKVKENKIVFCNFYGKGYGDSPKYIAEYIINNKLNYELVWLLNDKYMNETLPKEIKKVRYGTFKSMYELATAKIWIDNTRKKMHPNKNKNQYYIQTWHAGIGLKKVEQDAEETLPVRYIKIAKRDSKMIDLAISNSAYRTKMYKNGFWYDGEILECGTPRNDIFFDKLELKNINMRIRKKYNIDINKKIILYAPTLRKNSNYNFFDIEFEKIINELRKAYDTEFVFLLKLHPSFSDIIKINESSFINVSDYSDIDELLTITDILISDYSSVIFDFLFTKKPVYLYAPDYEEYINERGLNFNYKELPFCISYTKQELTRNLKLKKHKEYEEKLVKFLQYLDIKDQGQASKAVVEKIINIIEKGSEKNEKI